jgi:DNA-binding transcriptional MerR regulator
MRISEIVRRTGVSTATVKYYLREGLLPPGRPTSATQSEYDENHLARLKLIRALVDVGGLSLAAIRSVLDAIDAGPSGVAQAVGAAHSALSPVAGPPLGTDAQAALEALGGTSPALELLTGLGWSVDPGAPALHQLDAALAALAEVGLSPTPERLRTYAEAALTVAAADVSDVPAGPGPDTVAFIVLGTVLYEPVLLALRRLAQAHVYTTGPDKP